MKSPKKEKNSENSENLNEQQIDSVTKKSFKEIAIDTINELKRRGVDLYNQDHLKGKLLKNVEENNENEHIKTLFNDEKTDQTENEETDLKNLFK